MANIAKFEAHFTAAMFYTFIGEADKISNEIEELAALPDSFRPSKCKTLDKAQLQEKVTQAVNEVKNELSLEDVTICTYEDNAEYTDGIVYLRHSLDNQVGSDFDFYFPATDEWISIELKLGSATEVAAGIESINANVLFAEHIGELNEKRYIRRSMWMEGHEKEAIDIKDEFLKKTAAENASHIGQKLGSSGQKQLDAYYRGITGTTEIFNSDVKRSVVRLTLTSNGFKAHKMPSDCPSDWFLGSISVSRAGRLNFDVLSESKQVRFRFSLNWKNSYRLENGEKVAAKHGLGCPSYNVWQRKPLKSHMKQFFE